MTLSEFRSQLERLLPSPISRPFVCEGSPLECGVFIVGINSARVVEQPFWSFWSDSYGFKKTEFMCELEQLPDGLTNTRKFIEIVADAAGQKGTLDTNIYLSPTRGVEHLKREDKKTDVIEFLLETIKPKVILAHGDPVIEFFKRRCRSFVHDDVTPKEVIWDDGQWRFHLLCSYHLASRGLTHRTAAEKAQRKGQALAKALRAGHTEE